MLLKEKPRPLCSCGTPVAKSRKTALGIQLWKNLCNRCAKHKYSTRHAHRKAKKPQCEICGFIGDPCQLDVHHKDGNHRNNELTNLQTLCANCHRLVHKEEGLR